MVYDTETERYVPKWRLEEYPGINRDFKLLYYSPKRKQYRELDFEGNRSEEHTSELQSH